jgi:predicted ATPase
MGAIGGASAGDPTTLELLTLMIEKVQHLPVLLLITARPEFKQSWPAYEHVTDITLRRMGRGEGASLIGQVTGGKSLPKVVVDRIVDRTDGIPLFIEELTKTVIESGMLTDAGDRYTLAGPLRQFAIPATLHASLIERLDRLGPAKEVAQIGATIGREFSYELLAAVTDRTDTTIQTALGQLVSAGLLFRRGSLPEATFLFKHALVQDAAYGTLLKSSRQQLHGRIARMLERRFPDWTAVQPERVAHHYEEALLADQAIEYWERAGELAVWRSAMAEAVGHFTKALDLLTNLPESVYGKRKELALQLSLAGALTVNKGWASPQMGHAYARACDLARELGEFSQLMAALFGLYYFRHNRTEIDVGRQVVEELLDFGKQHDDTDAKLLAHTSFGASCLFHGEFANALMNMTKGLGYYDPSRHRPSISIPSDARVRCKSFTAWTLLFQGYPDRALVNSEEGLTYARELSSP